MKKILFSLLLLTSVCTYADVQYDSMSSQEKMVQQLELTNIQLKELISILIEMNGKLSSLEKNVDDLHYMMRPQAYNNEGKEIPWRELYP